jgi:hypothetical protein
MDLVNHVHAETLITERVIPWGTTSPKAVVLTQS